MNMARASQLLEKDRSESQPSNQLLDLDNALSPNIATHTPLAGVLVQSLVVQRRHLACRRESRGLGRGPQVRVTAHPNNTHEHTEHLYLQLAT